MFGILPPVNGQLGKVQERFIYDDQGRLAQSIDPRGNATKYEYDPRGLVIRTTDALGGVVETRYNAAGQAAWTRDAMGRITTTEYDALGRPIAVRDYGGVIPVVREFLGGCGAEFEKNAVSCGPNGQTGLGEKWRPP